MKVLELLCLTLISYKCDAIDIDDIALSDCSSYEGCEDTTNTEIGAPNFSQSSSAAVAVASEAEIGIDSFTTEYTKDNAKTTPTLQTTNELPTTVKPAIGTTIMNNIEQTTSLLQKNHSNICMCDVTISSCDINCCCDVDCNDFQLSVFSHCDNHHSKMYDSRYCYTKNFIQRNNTRFILERLASNLFCIAYDNLPPVYGISNVPDITNRNTFDDAKRVVDRNKNTWDWHNLEVPPEINFSRRYHDTDFVWKFQSNYVDLIELPRSGLTSKCTFGKSLKYLETYKSTCMQTDLRNNNSYLFTEIYENFTVIASPHLFNASYAKEEDHICPNNVCLPVRSLYCMESSSKCNTTKPPEQSCSNGTCRNALKRMRYTILHNGTDGIQSIEARFELTDVSQSFYQYFEVIYEWANEDRRHVFLRSGNNGYTVGKPIITGVLFANVTNGAKIEYINVNGPNYYLTVPMRRKNGHCDSRQRHIVGFGEDVRLTCNIELRTNNFSSDSCMDLQNQTLKLLLEDSLENVTAVDKFKTFVSKMGDILINDTSNWTQIILDRIPPYVVTGQIYNTRIRCSGLITSLHLEILHTILPKPEETNNYKIAGVSATFSEPIDVSWRKCHGTNCTDTLKVGVFTSVSFTDVSTPSMYYYAGGPNLDLSLPYDFFYPFMSSANNDEPLVSLLGFLSAGIIINSIYNLCTLL